jgi:hypothetical protein
MKRRLLSRKRRRFFFTSSQELVKFLCPKLFAHVPVESLKTWPRLVGKEIAEKGFCLPVNQVAVGAENKENKIKIVRISRRPSLFLSCFFSTSWASLRARAKNSPRSVHSLPSHHGSKNYLNLDF